MSLKLISGMMRSSGEEALLMMEAGGVEQLVIVSKQALFAMGQPPRCDESRLQEDIDLFAKLATAKYTAGSVDADGRIRIDEDDVAAWFKSVEAPT